MLNISGWTIVWVFLLILSLVLVITTWAFWRLIKPDPSNSDSQQEYKGNKPPKKPKGENPIYATDLNKKFSDLTRQIVELGNKTSIKKTHSIDDQQFFAEINNRIENFNGEVNKTLDLHFSVFSEKLQKILDAQGQKECPGCSEPMVPKNAKFCPQCAYEFNEKIVSKSI